MDARTDSTMEVSELTQLRKLQMTELSLLKEFARICEEQDIPYFLLGGTLLGAVRHKGFIPWDDDIDVCVARDDYDRFLAIAESKLPEDMYVASIYNDNMYRRGMARIATNKMQVINLAAEKKKIEDAWIDIIPLDGFPSNPLLATAHKARLFFWKSMASIAQYDELVDVNRKRGLLESMLVKLAGMRLFRWTDDYHKCLVSMDIALKKYRFEECNLVINFYAARGFKEIFHRRDFEIRDSFEFEDCRFDGPKNYRRVLETIYDENYMELPPEEDRNWHNCEVL